MIAIFLVLILFLFKGHILAAIAIFCILVAQVVALIQWYSLPKEVREKPSYYVQESLNSYWFYHITEDGKGLCGKKDLLNKRLPMENWGIVSPHIHEKYCKKCKEIYDEKNKIS